MDAAIRERILSLPQVVDAATVFCFISFADEVDTHTLIQRLQTLGKVILVPKTLTDGKMAAIRLESWDTLETDNFGIQVPPTSRAFGSAIDICLTPGLGFSSSGNRLGYGRGYYDNWFAINQVGHKIGIGYDCQVLEDIPVSETDVPLDMIISEKGIYRSHV